MTENTILVVDADQETEDKIVSTLEAEGYLVFTASGKNVSAGMAKKISFSLIYLKPTSSTIEGFETCRAIHKIEKFRDVPIVLLATLEGRVDPRYTTYYGIVDYLKMPLNTDELLEKTSKILSRSSGDIQKPEEAAVVEEEAFAEEEPAGGQEEYSLDTDVPEIPATVRTVEEEMGFSQEGTVSPETPDIQEEPAPVYEMEDIQEEPAARKADDTGQSEEVYDYSIEEEKQPEKKQATAREKDTQVKTKSTGLRILLLAVIAVIAIVVGFFSYRLYFSPAATEKPVAVEAPSVQPQEAVPAPLEEPQKPEQAVVEEPAPAETAKEVPVTVQEIKPKGKPMHSVQIGAFKTESSAEALVKKYKDKGYEAFTQKGTTKGNEVIYRVLIGKFENRKQAVQYATEIRTKEKTGTTVFSDSAK